MTQPLQTPVERFTGDGSTTLFPVTAFGAASSAAIEVWLDNVQQTEGVDYAISSLTPTGFDVDFAGLGGAPANLVVLTVRRNTEQTQATSYTEAGNFPSASHEAALDKLTRLVQDLNRRADASPELSPEVDPSSMILPAGDKFLRMSADGRSIVGSSEPADGTFTANDAVQALQDLGSGAAGKILRYTGLAAVELLTFGGLGKALGLLGNGVDGSVIRMEGTESAAQLSLAAQEISASTVLDDDDDMSLLNVDASGAARTITLPALATARPGYSVWVKKTDAVANDVTVAADAGDGAAIDGAASFAISFQGDSARIVRNSAGTAWRVSKAFQPSSAFSVTMQVFTSDDTWNRPAGVTKALVFALGAGGGGGGAGSTIGGQGAAGGGGAAGALSIALLDVTSISSATLTIGQGGPGGAAGANDGTDGEDTIWSDGTNTITASGGGGGIGGTAGSVSQDGGIGGSGVAATGGDINGAGQDGDAGIAGNSDYRRGGSGAGSFLGGGGVGDITSGSLAYAGNAGTGYGSGGGGALTIGAGGSGGRAGGNGANGIIFVLELA